MSSVQPVGMGARPQQIGRDVVANSDTPLFIFLCWSLLVWFCTSP